MSRGAVAERDVRTEDADVYKQGVLAARLSRGPGEVVFGYDQEYLAEGLPAVATSLPLTAEPVVVRGGGVPPYFAGLLPEGRRLSGLRRAVKTSADDELSLLLAVGQDPVGDVQVAPAGERPSAGDSLVTVERDFAEVSFGDILAEAGVVDPTALAGVQDKASARMMSVPIGAGSGRFVLKVDPPEYPHIVVNEAYFIGVAARGGIPTVHARTVHDRTGRPGLLVDRFDRITGPDDSIRSLAVEDGTQVLGPDLCKSGRRHRRRSRPVAGPGAPHLGSPTAQPQKERAFVASSPRPDGWGRCPAVPAADIARRSRASVVPRRAGRHECLLTVHCGRRPGLPDRHPEVQKHRTTQGVPKAALGGAVTTSNSPGTELHHVRSEFNSSGSQKVNCDERS
ncbi:MAG: type II toxin-antitoxin system HipA family toxin [Dermatophilaceae bacterium]